MINKIIILVGCCYFLSFSVFADQPQITMFVPHGSWASEQQTDKLIATAIAAGIDGLAVNVWHGRGAAWDTKTRFKSSVLKKTKLKDPFSVLIQKAHKNNIQIIPVVSVAHRSSKLMPEYAEGQGLKNAYDLHNKNFQQHMLLLITELVTRYDIDGLNLDYIRTKGVCSSNKCKKDYLSFSGRNLSVDKASYKHWDAAKNAIIKWNSAPIIDFLKEVKKITLSKKIPLSVDSHPGYDGFKVQGANSIEWLESGLVDYIYSMNYQSMKNMPKQKLMAVLKGTSKPGKILLTIGNFIKEKNVPMSQVLSRNADEFLELVKFAKTYNVANQGKFVLFTYRFLTDEHIKILKNNS